MRLQGKFDIGVQGLLFVHSFHRSMFVHLSLHLSNHSFVHSFIRSIFCSSFSPFFISLFHLQSGCDQSFIHQTGTFSSENSGGKYLDNLDCTYDIKLTDQTKGIRLMWDEFDIKGNMPKCENDYMEIFIGCSHKSIGRYCSDNVAGGLSKMFDVYSPDNCLRLKFHSDGSTAGRGYKATYIIVNMSKFIGWECTITIVLKDPVVGCGMGCHSLQFGMGVNR